jgi:hypothetical protein
MPSTQSAVDICNIALGHIQARRISSMSDGSTEANLCNTHYNQIRESLLQEYDWPFARKRSPSLGLLYEYGDDEVPDGWQYGYQLPTDCLAIRIAEELPVYNDLTQPYYIVGDVIFCNTDELHLIYTYNLTDTTKFSPKFATAFGLHLAIPLTIALPHARSLNQAAIQQAAAALALAKTAAAREQPSSKPPADSWLRSRRRGGGGSGSFDPLPRIIR